MSEQIKVDDPFLGPDISSSPPVNRILEVTNGFHLCCSFCLLRRYFYSWENSKRKNNPLDNFSRGVKK